MIPQDESQKKVHAVDEKGRVIIALSEPIPFGANEMITEFRIRKPKAKDLRKMKGDPDMGEILDLAGKLAAQPTSVVDELSVPDMMEVCDVVGNFIAGGR